MNLYHCPRCTQDYWMGDGPQRFPMLVLNCPFCQEDINRENAGLPPMDQIVDAWWDAEGVEEQARLAEPADLHPYGGD